MLKVTKYGAEWCAPCKLLSPIFKMISESTEGVEFVSVDIDEEPELSTTMNIRSVPTLIFEKDGAVVDSMVGLAKEQDIRDRIEGLK